METNSLTPSSMPGPLPPGAEVALSLEPSDPGSLPSIVPLPPPPQSAGNQNPGPTPPAGGRRQFGLNDVSVPVGRFLAKALEERWRTYRKELRRCQEHFSEGAVHQLRVATRRLLAQFLLLDCVAPSVGLDKARPILKCRLAALGDLRDTQVQRGFIEEQSVRFPELAPLRAWLVRRERKLARSAAKRVQRFRTNKLGKWISTMSEDLSARAGNARARKQLAAAVARAAADAFAETLRRRRAIDPANRRTIHKTRIAFKRFRYMMESLSPDLTGLSKRRLRTLAYYQRKMGIIQDLEVMQRCVARFVHEHRESKAALRPFCSYLQQRQARALRSFLLSADDLLGFWPPARLTGNRASVPTRNAA